MSLARKLFQKVILESSKERLSSSLRSLQLEMKESLSRSDLEFATVPEVSSIICTGEGGGIRFSCIYSLETAKIMAQEQLQLNKEKVTDVLGRDFMNEYANLQGGAIRTLLEKLGGQWRIGLPRHFQFFHDFQKTQLEEADELLYWGLKKGESEFVLCLEFDFKNNKFFEQHRDDFEKELNQLFKQEGLKLIGEVEFFDLAEHAKKPA